MLAAGPAGLLAFAPLMQPAPGQAAEAWLRQCVQAVQALPLAELARGNLVGGLSVLSGLVYAPETIAAILSQEGIMDLIRESSQLPASGHVRLEVFNVVKERGGSPRMKIATGRILGDVNNRRQG